MLHGNLHETVSSSNEMFMIQRALPRAGTTLNVPDLHTTIPSFFSDLAKLLFSATFSIINATISYIEKHLTFFVLNPPLSPWFPFVQRNRHPFSTALTVSLTPF